MNNPDVWNKIWGDTSSENDFPFWVRREIKGVRGRKILVYLNKHLGSSHGIKTVEVGSGLGVYSFILAHQGAEVTLMDYSQEALSLAERNFSREGVKAAFLLRDALDVPSSPRQEFDLAMSFGTVEHFEGEKRFLIAKAHFDLVRPGGLVIISVPNRLFFPHEILNFFLHKINKWPLGYERAFSRSELLELAGRIGLENVEIGGSAFITDFFRYIFVFASTNFFKRFFRTLSRQVYFNDRASLFDDLFGADIFLMGCKPFSV